MSCPGYVITGCRGSGGSDVVLGGGAADTLFKENENYAKTWKWDLIRAETETSSINNDLNEKLNDEISNPSLIAEIKAKRGSFFYIKLSNECVSGETSGPRYLTGCRGGVCNADNGGVSMDSNPGVWEIRPKRDANGTATPNSYYIISVAIFNGKWNYCNTSCENSFSFVSNPNTERFLTRCRGGVIAKSVAMGPSTAEGDSSDFINIESNVNGNNELLYKYNPFSWDIQLTDDEETSPKHTTGSIKDKFENFNETVIGPVRIASCGKLDNGQCYSYDCGMDTASCGKTNSCGTKNAAFPQFDELCQQENNSTQYYCKAEGTTPECDCDPDCSEQSCGGSDGCGGICGKTSATDQKCRDDNNNTQYFCNDETKSCDCNGTCLNQNCGGPDGCGGICGGGNLSSTCPNAKPNTICTEAGACVCTPNCSGQNCGGPDGCGGKCVGGNGACPAEEVCSNQGVCFPINCQPNCSGKNCGEDDECGGYCTGEDQDQKCRDDNNDNYSCDNVTKQCECTYDETKYQCGITPCGNIVECPDDKSCNEKGECVSSIGGGTDTPTVSLVVIIGFLVVFFIVLAGLAFVAYTALNKVSNR